MNYVENTDLLPLITNITTKPINSAKGKGKNIKVIEHVENFYLLHPPLNKINIILAFTTTATDFLLRSTQSIIMRIH